MRVKMAATMLSPGVQITEIDEPNPSNEISISTIAMVGGARKGPLTPVLIRSKKEALQTFGEPIAKDFGIYSLFGALDKSDQIYYRRVIKEKSFSKAGGGEDDKFTFTSLVQSSTANGIVVLIEITSEGSQDDYSDYQFKVTVIQNEIKEEYEDCTLATVAEKINGKSKLVTVSVDEGEDVPLKRASYTLTGGGKGVAYATTPETDDVNFASKTFDSTLNGYSISLSEADFLGNFSLQLLNGKGEVIEELRSMNTDPSADRYIETYVNNYSSYLTCSYNPDTEIVITGKTYKLTGGMDGTDGIDADTIIKGLDDYSNPEAITVDLLCAPGWSDVPVIDHAVKLCEERQDCMYIIDPPFGMAPKQVVNWTNAQGEYDVSGARALDSSYAAVYWPWVKAWDDYSKTNVWLPPSGFIAGQIVYSDSVSNNWYAPAGTQRGVLTNISDIEISPSKEERDLLYGNSNIVNPIMNYRGKGFIIWGQKTTQRKFSALDRINVRRLVNYLKRIITTVSLDFVFEPNTEYTWLKWVDTVEPYLSSIQDARGIYDYQIYMDGSTITEDDINNNRMPGIIRFRPTRTAEFIPIQFILSPTGATFISSNSAPTESV